MSNTQGKPRSESRQRVKLVAVRLTPAEYAYLAETAERTGKGDSTLLREAFLDTSPMPAAKTCAWAKCGKTFYRGENGRSEAEYCCLQHERNAAQARWRQRKKEKAGQ